MTQFAVDIPPVDSTSPWVVIEIFDNKKEALNFAQTIFGCDDNGFLCLISFDGEYHCVDVPNPHYQSRNNQFLDVEGFRHLEDAVDFAIANYHADSQGRVCLISKI